MFIVVTTSKGTVNLSNFSLWYISVNQNETDSIFAHSRGKDFFAEVEKSELGDCVVLGVYPTEAAVKQAMEELNQAILDGEKGFAMT